MEGYWNVDVVSVPGVDQVLNLELFGAYTELPSADYKEIMLSHVIEHLSFPLQLMENLYRAAAPGATLTIRCPYGSSDDADEDPTHVRRMFLQSFGYFSQPFYWRAQYNTIHEKDLFDNTVHPNPLCPWYVQGSLLPVVENGGPRGDDRSARGLHTMRSSGLHSAALREGMVSPALQTSNGQRSSGADGNSPQTTERQGEVHEGRLLVHDRSSESVKDDWRSQVQHGDAPQAETSPVGERSSQEWERQQQRIVELGTLVQTAAGRTASRGLAELARLLVPDRIAKDVALGTQGCCCKYKDYGYRGDWQPESITLWVAHQFRHMPELDLWEKITHQRNVVAEMVCVMKAVKPMREPLRELQVHPRYIIGRPE